MDGEYVKNKYYAGFHDNSYHCYREYTQVLDSKTRTGVHLLTRRKFLTGGE